MKIHQVLTRSRFDFKAIMQCEHCEQFQTDPYGYDDDNYHQNVIPKFLCLHCGKNRAGTTEGFERGVKVRPKKIATTSWEQF